MYRKIITELKEWKDKKDRLPLILKGARQVGKTWILQEFGKECFDDVLYINFENAGNIANLFEGSIEPNRIIEYLSALNHKKIEPEKTLIIFDEIQELPRALTSLKYFAEETPEYAICCAGSLLGVFLHDQVSFPVGKVDFLELQPLDFEEFLWGIGIKKETINYAKDCFENIKPMDEYIMKQLAEQFKMYMLVGGMPNVVNEYVQTSSLSKVLILQRAIVENYLLDVVKFAETSNKQKIINAFNSIPIQLSKKNKKFLFSEIKEDEENVGERKYASSIEWLKDAGIINFCYNLAEPALPLISNIRLNCFKIYMRDTGLLVSMLEEGTQKAILDDDLYINQGALLENVCAEEIATRHSKLMYFERKSTLEIDFVLNIEGKVTAIEVKSGKNKQAKSLKSIIQNYKTVTRYMKFENDCNIYKDEENIEHYPLFMIMFI